MTTEKVLRITIRATLVAIGVVILLCLAVWAARAIWRVEVSASCSTDSEGRLVINVRKTFRVPGMMVFLRLSDRPYESLWGVDLGSRRSCSITYGQVPDGARQLRPEPGNPIEAIPPGSVFRVEVYYTYHATRRGADYFTYRMTEDGQVVPAPDQAWWPEARAWPIDDDPEPSPPSQ